MADLRASYEKVLLERDSLAKQAQAEGNQQVLVSFFFVGGGKTISIKYVLTKQARSPRVEVTFASSEQAGNSNSVPRGKGLTCQLDTEFDATARKSESCVTSNVGGLSALPSAEEVHFWLLQQAGGLTQAGREPEIGAGHDESCMGNCSGRTDAEDQACVVAESSSIDVQESKV